MVTSQWAPATIDIDIVASGGVAAAARQELESVDRKQLEELRRTRRESVLDRRLTLVELTWKDDELADQVSIHLRYQTASWFDEDLSVDFRPLVLDDELTEPPAGARRQPLALNHLVRIVETVVYSARGRLDPLRFSFTNRTISDPAFELAISQGLRDRTLSLSWSYSSKTDRLLPEALERYRASVREARGSLWYGITSRRPSPGAGSESIFGWVALLVGSGGCNAARPVSWPRRRSSLSASATRKATSRAVSVPPATYGHQESRSSTGIRLGEERILIVGRRCERCAASEHRYVRLRGGRS